MPKRLSGTERRAKRAAAFQLFARQYARRAHAGFDPNDRRYDRSIEAAAKRMSSEALDALLRHGEDELGEA